MRKVHEKSILLGIGIGMIITAIAGLIYSAGTQKELTKDEIISRAKSYGLIEPVKILNENNSAADSTVAVTTPEKSTPAVSTSSQASTEENKKTDTAKPSKTGTVTNERNIAIKIERGNTAVDVMKQLLNKGVITSEKDFSDMVYSYRASRKIVSGTYMFKKNEDLAYIVKKICGFK
ncbi:ABC transporter substrate-binding protein [Ruminiclostridium cellulolyticum]|uniref:Aminodeoxychorismate lyase n=1 Tax=Ruminiclostridium cellulolyticum (strain ATCC 35319 / DSM 5812 / JCM 6584 / H10) TaxID=394503 RepID=B8I3M1_RUMCH|nr:ABC transporter substrate-binding protein [Ruminiclostridium cellulolyticum]ACL76364.1 hypothetical protein Ccel_2018 [Ruminiclostridium cellulolyticum H10]